jgi:hypothetical protein
VVCTTGRALFGRAKSRPKNNEHPFLVLHSHEAESAYFVIYIKEKIFKKSLNNQARKNKKGYAMNDKEKAFKEAYDKLPPTGKYMFNGAIAGAAIGSVIPIVGTAAGSFIGGGVGLALKVKENLKNKKHHS